MLELFTASLRAETEEELRAGDGRGGRFLELMGEGHDFAEALPFEGASHEAPERQSMTRKDPASLSRSQDFQFASLSSSDPVLAQFCSALRESTEIALEASPQRVNRSKARSRRHLSRWAPTAGLAAVAAVALLLVGIPEVIHFGQKLQGQVASMAPWNEDKVVETRAVTKVSRRKLVSSTQVSRSQGLEPAQDEDLGEDNTRLDESVPSSQEGLRSELEGAEISGGALVPSPKKLSDRVLMRQAHTLWRAGKTRRAQRLFRRVAYRSSNRDSAQAAYADLFSIGRQLGGRSVLVKEWSRYLKKFPQGRYAQDALAGLCLVKEDRQVQKECWNKYLERFPRGVYARKARKILGPKR